MSVLRIYKKQNNFVILDKTCLNTNHISWGAKGLHAFLISLPDDWKIRVSDLQKRATNGRDATRKFLNELENAGYIKKTPKRNDSTGRFNGVEYLVLEAPNLNIEQDLSLNLFIPITEEPSPDNPEPDNPSPEKTNLININRINNNKINNKTAAGNEFDSSIRTMEESRTIAHSRKEACQIQKKSPIPKEIYILSQEDAIVDKVLSKNQINRVQRCIEKFPLRNKRQLFEEISFCLLDKTQFKGCGNDFSKKLNAIRAVVLRGEWQTPTKLISKRKNKGFVSIKKLDHELYEAYSEINHFQRLLSTAKGDARLQFESIIQKAKIKIRKFEENIRRNYHSSKEEEH